MAPLMGNVPWLLAALPEAAAFGLAAQDVAGAQRRLLLTLLRRNRDSAFGRRHGFAGIRSLDDYRERVPLSTYADYEEAVERIAAGERGVLTHEPVSRLVPTSGTAATKRIPCTASLLRQIRRGVGTWIADLFRGDPTLLASPAYWSISPASLRDETTPGGIPIGFADDSEYLGGLGRLVARHALAVPPEVRLEPDIDRWRDRTLVHLLRCRSLGLVSVWHPSFLTLLLAPLRERGEQLADEVALADPARAAELRRHLRRARSPGALHRLLWPELRLLSCWTDAQAAPYRSEAERLFPGVAVQGKGLVATEGLVSLPLRGLPAPVLAVRSHVFELLDGSGQALAAHQAAKGERYEVVLTTGGGLYRYRLGDLVEVEGHLDQAPLLRFVGRTGDVSDRFGEKLHEEHVRRALETLFGEADLAPRFAMLAFDAGLRGYVLFVEDARAGSVEAGRLDTFLSANVHYRHCRRLGQLAAPRVFAVESGGVAAYFAEAQRRGRRPGDVKLPALDLTSTGWRDIFRGRLLG